MDPDAKVQVATLGTALFYTTTKNEQSSYDFVGKNGVYTVGGSHKDFLASIRMYKIRIVCLLLYLCCQQLY